LTFGETPIVCGGSYYWSTTYQQCWTYIGGVWQQTTFNMAWPNKFFAMTQSPFKNSSQSLFMTGGYNGTSDIDKAAVIQLFFLHPHEQFNQKSIKFYILITFNLQKY
jgi:hypothetical protein